jgi:hypothetical protein
VSRISAIPYIKLLLQWSSRVVRRWHCILLCCRIWHFRGTCCLHLQVPPKFSSKWGVADYSEMVVDAYRTTHRLILEDSHLWLCWSLSLLPSRSTQRHHLFRSRRPVHGSQIIPPYVIGLYVVINPLRFIRKSFTGTSMWRRTLTLLADRFSWRQVKQLLPLFQFVLSGIPRNSVQRSALKIRFLLTIFKDCAGTDCFRLTDTWHNLISRCLLHLKTLYREYCLSDRREEVCSIQFILKYGFYLENAGDDYWIHTWDFWILD